MLSRIKGRNDYLFAPQLGAIWNNNSAYARLSFLVNVILMLI